MYIDFMDILKDIKHGIYPKVSEWRDDVEQFHSQTEQLKNDVVETVNNVNFVKKQTEALKLTAESFIESEYNTPVKQFVAHEDGTISSSEIIPHVYSAIHWNNVVQNTSNKEKFAAEAAKLTAASFASEPYGKPVKKYTSNGDGTFTVKELKNIFSALHHREDTEKLSGHKRWVETQFATEDNHAVFSFTKTISDSDVYVNGKRKIKDIDYNAVLSTITFDPELDPGDIVTVSGMEAITGSEFQTLLEQTKEVEKITKQDEWEAKAAEMTAKSYASEPVDQYVKEYTSNGDGTFTVIKTLYYSALHWSVKLNIANSSIVIVDKYEDLDLLNVNYAKVAYVRGGYQLDDGKQGIFDFYEENSDINNHGTNINGWRRRYFGYAKLSWFDVNADGSNDDYNSIKAALDDCRYLDFEDKEYAISQEIVFDGHFIKSNNAKIVSLQDEGVAIKFKNYNNQNVIDGNLIVDFYGNPDYSKDRTCISISDSIGSAFNVKSAESSYGIVVEPIDNDVIANTINVNNVKDCIQSVVLKNNTSNLVLKANKINIDLAKNSHQVESSDVGSSDSSLLFIDGNNIFDNDILCSNLVVENNNNRSCDLFKLNSDNNKLKILSASTSDSSQYVSEIKGENCILDIENAIGLKAYLWDENGVQSNIDITSCNDIIVYGKQYAKKTNGLAVELYSNSNKPTQTIQNDNGIATEYPVKQDGYIATRIYNRDGNAESTHSDINSKYIKHGDKSSTISYDKVILKNESNSDKVIIENTDINVSDDSNSVNIDKSQIEISDDDNHTSIFSSEKITFSDDNSISSLLDKDKLVVSDNSDSAHIKKDVVKVIDDNLGSYLYKDGVAILDNGYGLRAAVGSIISNDADGNKFKINEESLELYDDGVLKTKISRNGECIFNERKVDWIQSGKPTSIDKIGSIRYESNPEPDGYVGYVYVSKGSTTGDTSSGSADITNIDNISLFNVNDEVIGDGVPSGSQVVSIDADNNTITISNECTDDGSSISLDARGWKGFGKIEA